MKDLAPGCPILADTKTVDGGAKEAKMVFSAGASMMTVLACASPATHEAVNRVACDYDAQVVVDTICGQLPDRPSVFPDRYAYLALHSPTDPRLTGAHSTAHIDAVPAMRRLGYRVSLAGGIGTANLADAVAAGPKIVVIGAAITQAADPRSTAQWIASQLTEPGRGSTPAPNSAR
jgi:3-keto-L-gulonate-6-phosphate decarboxylase